VIEKLKQKNLIDIIDLLNEYNDSFNDLYITIDKSRIFLKNNWSLIGEILEHQECYGYFEKDGLKGILLVYREKNFRPYLKIFAANCDKLILQKLMKFFVWNRNEIDVFCKLKSDNPIVNILKKFGFFVKGLRGTEVLLFKKGYKNTYKLIPKDVWEK